jgi:hypothetical protein
MIIQFSQDLFSLSLFHSLIAPNQAIDFKINILAIIQVWISLPTYKPRVDSTQKKYLGANEYCHISGRNVCQAVEKNSVY